MLPINITNQLSEAVSSKVNKQVIIGVTPINETVSDVHSDRRFLFKFNNKTYKSKIPYTENITDSLVEELVEDLINVEIALAHALYI
jgi:hypothetical protein